MQGTPTQNQSNFSVFLLGAILNILAAVDYVSLIDYSLKAIIGGLIWLGFKITSEIIMQRMSVKKKKEAEDNE
ncbi:MAG TPA: hypothetical protein VNW99_07900 [Cytophagaceae bacterium]|jgi:hypothetical protein|nr:hypothetical protein [Cytophagaceae bacterium]